MKELLLDILGWLGYLERPVVQVQLLISLGLIVLSRQARRRRWLGSALPARAIPHLGQLMLAVGCLLLAGLGQPVGLALLIGALWLSWSVLGLLTLLLKRWLPEAEVHRLDTRLLRPSFLVVAALLVVSEFASLHDLGVIPLGQWLGVSLTTEKVFNALLVIYLVLVGCGPPATGIAWLMQRALGMSDGSRKASELMLRYTVVGLGLVGVAVHLGLNTTALIAVAGSW